MYYNLKRKMTELIEMIYSIIDLDILKSYENFTITLSKKILKKNESYLNREFVIYNLYRQEAELVNSLIICLAHHIDYCNTGETKKSSPEFIGLYEKILHTALNSNMLDYEQLRKSNDYQNQKRLQEVLSSYWYSDIGKDENIILEIYNCFKIKDILKSQGFRYNVSYGSWELEVPRNQFTDFQNSLKKLDDKIIIKSRNCNKIVFVVDCLIEVVGKSFKYKDQLKANNYYFSNGKWIKKIKGYQFLEEKEKIESIIPKGLGIKVDIDFQ